MKDQPDPSPAASYTDVYQSKVNGRPTVSAQERNEVLVKLAAKNPAVMELINKLVKE